MYFKYNRFCLSIDHLNLDKMTTLSGNYPPCRYHPKINISLQSLKYKAKHVSVNFGHLVSISPSQIKKQFFTKGKTSNPYCSKTKNYYESDTHLAFTGLVSEQNSWRKMSREGGRVVSFLSVSRRRGRSTTRALFKAHKTVKFPIVFNTYMNLLTSLWSLWFGIVVYWSLLSL